MTINEIFKEISYGKDYCIFEAAKESLENAYDKESDIFYASKRIDDITDRLSLNEEDEKVVSKIRTKCELVEEKLFAEQTMSPVYKKLSATAIIDECDRLISRSEKRTEYAAMKNSDAIAKVVATASYFVENYLDDKVRLRNGSNIKFNSLISEEADTIKKVL